MNAMWLLTAVQAAVAAAMSKASISHHLGILRNAHLVSIRKEGQFIYYTLDQHSLNDILQWITSLTSFSNIKTEKQERQRTKDLHEKF